MVRRLAWYGGLAVPEVRKERPEAHRCWKTTGRADPAGPCYRCRGPDSADPPPLARGSRAAPRVADGAGQGGDTATLMATGDRSVAPCNAQLYYRSRMLRVDVLR
jgi:hypothetical protein